MFPSCTFVPLVVNALANCATTFVSLVVNALANCATTFVYLCVLGGERPRKLRHDRALRGCLPVFSNRRWPQSLARIVQPSRDPVNSRAQRVVERVGILTSPFAAQQVDLHQTHRINIRITQADRTE